ncbi:alpha/beta hydrolase [Flavobacterium sp. LM5]|uniref:alpha/beta fold hydrolase n=1 Tax=Flavobacterium sp. LM5 TaxID=1938610 RepID=UPI0009928A90|nr:alpha/beta hydrolase [Flavobacterium sp. LM5]OOV25547.1 alpha/beta hydrolase [Flavobacterium sp. LM5]
MKNSIFALLIVVMLSSTNLFSQNSFNVKIAGKGNPVLLFPGFGCTGQVWDETVAAISKTNKCYIFTFAGFGNSKPIDSPWFETIKKDLEKYIVENKLTESTLLGHSIGGTLSLWLASSNPQWFKELILVDALPASAALMIPNYKGDVIPYDNPQSKSMLKMSDADFQKMNNQSVMYMCNNKEKQKLLAEMMNQSDRKTFIYGYVDMLNLDLRSEITKIKKPVTILAATNPSLEMVTKTYNDQYKNLPSATILYAEKAAHFVMFDQPEWYLKQIKQILN